MVQSPPLVIALLISIQKTRISHIQHWEGRFLSPPALSSQPLQRDEPLLQILVSHPFMLVAQKEYMIWWDFFNCFHHKKLWFEDIGGKNELNLPIKLNLPINPLNLLHTTCILKFYLTDKLPGHSPVWGSPGRNSLRWAAFVRQKEVSFFIFTQGLDGNMERQWYLDSATHTHQGN